MAYSVLGPHRPRRAYRCGRFLRMSHVAWSVRACVRACARVCVCVCWARGELFENDWTDQDAVWGHEEPWIRWVLSSNGKGNFHWGGVRAFAGIKSGWMHRWMQVGLWRWACDGDAAFYITFNTCFFQCGDHGDLYWLQSRSLLTKSGGHLHVPICSLFKPPASATDNESLAI